MMLRPTLALVTKLDSLGLHDLDPAIDEAFFQLEIGDAVHQQSADAVGPLEDGDDVAGLVELGRARQARRAGADDGDLLPGAFSGGSGLIQPCSKACSMMLSSMFLIVTGLLLMPRTQASSHGAGQTRPVNSGKLLVLKQHVQRIAPAVADRPDRSIRG